MSMDSDGVARTRRIRDFALALDELRAVTAFNVACAELAIGAFEDVLPGDSRPRQALEAGAAFVAGGPRTRTQRVTALQRMGPPRRVHPSRPHMLPRRLVIDVLLRYPPVAVGRQEVAAVMYELDTSLRAMRV